MPSLRDCTDLDFWYSGMIDLYGLADDPGVLGGFDFVGCEHDLTHTISEDGEFFRICRKCHSVVHAEPDEDALLVSQTGAPTLVDIIAVKLLLAE